MKSEVTVKDSITISLDQMRAFCRNGCELKYARKLINDQLKLMTGIPGYWTVWFEEDDGYNYWFKLDNPLWKLANGLQS